MFRCLFTFATSIRACLNSRCCGDLTMFIPLFHDKEVTPHRSDRFAMEANRAVDCSRQAGWLSTHDRDAGCAQRHLYTFREPVVLGGCCLTAYRTDLPCTSFTPAGAATGLRKPSTPRYGNRFVANRNPKPSLASRCSTAKASRHRSKRGIADSTRGKKSTAESGACSLTRSAWSSSASCTRPVCRIATALSGYWRPRRSISRSCESFEPMPHALAAWLKWLRSACGWSDGHHPPDVARVRRVAEALGHRTHICLAQPLPPPQQRLRRHRRIQQIHDLNQHEQLRVNPLGERRSPPLDKMLTSPEETVT